MSLWPELMCAEVIAMAFFLSFSCFEFFLFAASRQRFSCSALRRFSKSARYSSDDFFCERDSPGHARGQVSERGEVCSVRDI